MDVLAINIYEIPEIWIYAILGISALTVLSVVSSIVVGIFVGIAKFISWIVGND